MFDLSTQKIVFLVGLAVYTIVTSWTDLRSRKIYNFNTVPMWVAGWIYQAVFFQWDGVVDGLCGFGIGFGLFFLLWMIGSAGGGDVKLIGALSVWLGPGLTLKVILASLIFVVIGTFGTFVASMCTQGWRRTRGRYVAQKSKGKSASKSAESVESRSKRRVMAFAMPVALATWSVLFAFQNQW